MPDEKKSEEKIDYITGAVHKIEKIDDNTNEITLYDDQHTYFCGKSIDMKASAGYKFGIKRTDNPNRFEIVSIEQQLLKSPAFEAKVGETKVVQLPLDDYKELITAKNIRVRDSCLKAAIEICDKGGMGYNGTHVFLKEVLLIARELEKYFI